MTTIAMTTMRHLTYLETFYLEVDGHPVGMKYGYPTPVTYGKALLLALLAEEIADTSQALGDDCAMTDMQQAAIHWSRRNLYQERAREFRDTLATGGVI